MTATTLPLRANVPLAARRATRDILPIALAVLPFGTVIGVTLDQAGLRGVPALLATALLYAGSSQLATLSILIAGGGALSAVFAGSLVNSRMLLYSAGLSERFGTQPAWFRWTAPLLTVDQTFALATAQTDLDDRDFRTYWLTMGGVLGALWIAATAVGLAIGGVLPTHSPMSVAAPATILVLLVPHLRDARMRRVVGVAVVAALVGPLLPSGLGIVFAISLALLTAPRAQDADAASEETTP